MGERGSIPKPAHQRSRTAPPAGGYAQPHPAGDPVQWPEPGEHWDVPVVRWYRAQQRSGQADLLEQSDVETLWLWADAFDEKRKSGDVKPSFLSAFSAACRDLLVTEGARRRSRIELERDTEGESQQPGADVASLYSRLKSS